MFNKDNINNARKKPKIIPKFLSKTLIGVLDILETIKLLNTLIKEYINKNNNAKDILSAKTAISIYSFINKLILGYKFIEIYPETNGDVSGIIGRYSGQLVVNFDRYDDGKRHSLVFNCKKFEPLEKKF